MFIDRALITIKAGDGGNGITSFIHYKGKVSGGPDGGDGGKGGDIIFVADKHLTNLSDYYYKTRYVAQNGEQGGSKDCFGKSGEDLVLKVPLGTVIKDRETGNIIADMFYEETGDKKYLTLLRRIFFNGLNHCHRDNGGVGTSKTVYEENNYAGMGSHYEAVFCCTMRYCEGLITINKNRDNLAFNQNAPIIKDELGRRFKDDALVIQNENGEDLMAFDLAFQEKNDRKYKVF